MKRKIFIVITVLALVLSLAACTGNKDQGTDDPKTGPITQETVDGAAQMLYEYNKPGQDNSVSATFSVPTKIIDYEGYDLDVEWSVSGAEGLVSLVPDGDSVKVVVDPNADQDTPFTLKGLVKGGEFTKEISMDYVIKAFEVATWDYWAENTKDVTMNIRGIVVAKYPYNEANKNVSVFLQDLDGEHGYFAYRMKCDSKELCDTELAIGNVIIVNGTTSIYNGFREMGAGCTYTLLTDASGNPRTGEIKKFAMDDLFDGSDINAKLDPKQGLIATITGAQVKSIDWNTNTADTFVEKGAGSVYVTITKNDVEFKLYLSTSNTLTVEEMKAEYDKLGVGYTIDVEGPISWYNAPQIYPCAGGIKVGSTDIADADKISNELAVISIPDFVSENTSVTLPVTGATYENVTFAWELKEGTAAAIDGDKLGVTVGNTVETVKLAVTATCGSEKQEKEYSITVMPANMTEEDIVNALYNVPAGNSLPGTFTLTGVITKVNTEYNAEYSNVTVTIQVGDLADKQIQCFRLKGTGADQIGEGDTITVTGVLKNYNGTREFDANCNLDSFVRAGDPQPTDKPADPTPVPTDKPADPTEPPAETAAEILTKLYALEAGEKLEGEYTLTGVITAVNTPFSTQYNNVTVTIVIDGDEARPVQCFRLEGEGSDKIKKGDTITVKGVLKNYNGTREFDAACKLVSIDKVGEVQDNPYKTTEEIMNALYALKDNETLVGPYTLTGKITTIDTAWSDQHSNITVTIIVDGYQDKPVMCYRLAGDGAKDLKEGDVITVTGDFKNYKGTYEFTQGCHLDSVTAG